MTSRNFGRVSRDRAVELSLDAAMEIEDVITGASSDAPKLRDLIETLSGSEGGNLSKKSLLSDVRAASLYGRAAAVTGRQYQSVSDLDQILDLFLKIYKLGLKPMQPEDLEFARDFCLGLNRQLIDEAYGRTPEPPRAQIRSRRSHTQYAR
ncbi:hypothetical protein HFO58_10720 [Rhizobium leguminosarum]|uniref:hypothetical protein n=1 Tax=Rhizobium leguminosarum TaxID=384 RepID=UPI001C93D62B|nr:hypothetical protein [Rhizobium leguminosarum]MBY5533635.1 hypothetical protein [Rhizobium leguminosarum]